MRHEFGSFEEPGVLAPTMPIDIGARSQRQRILAAMADSCAEKAFASVTIADIVAHASISRATFYKHFENKRECFEAAVEHFAGMLEAAAGSAYASAPLPTKALQSAIATVLQLLAANPPYAKLLLIEAPTVDPTIVGRYRDRVIGALEAAQGPRKTLDESGPDPRIAFGRAQVLMADYVAAGRAEELPELAHELVYIALLPFVGQKRALDQAKLAR
jgi:AcrR family transcriptional regulator